MYIVQTCQVLMSIFLLNSAWLIINMAILVYPNEDIWEINETRYGFKIICVIMAWCFSTVTATLENWNFKAVYRYFCTQKLM